MIVNAQSDWGLNMDPNATLEAIFDSDNTEDATEYCEILATWLRYGGFAPTVEKGRKWWPGTNTPYAILSPMADSNHKWLFVIYDTKGNRAETWELDGSNCNCYDCKE